jgi:hypothetical protein
MLRRKEVLIMSKMTNVFAAITVLMAISTSPAVAWRPCAAAGSAVLDTRAGDHDHVFTLGSPFDARLEEMALGDLDGDGVLDVALSAPSTRGGPPTRALAGEVHVFFGPRSPGATPLASTPGDLVVLGTEREALGTHLLVADVSGDGREDLVMTAPGGSTRRSDGTYATGAVHVLFGPLRRGLIELADVGADVSITAPTILMRLVERPPAAGDVDGDGYVDLLVTARPTPPGQVLVFPGPLAAGTRVDLGSTAADMTVHGRPGDMPGSGDSLGSSIVIADFTGDGSDDLVLGTSLATPHGVPFAGGAVALLGPLSRAVNIDLVSDPPDIVFEGLHGWHSVGELLGSGDFNGDGVADLVIPDGEADRPDGSALEVGEVRIFLGPLERGVFPLDAASGDVLIRGDMHQGRLATSIAAGDLNEDGIDDLLLGQGWSRAPLFVGPLGRAFLLLSPVVPGMVVDLAQSPSDVTFLGDSTHYFFGGRSAVGDVSGDGHADAVIGALPWFGLEGAVSSFFGPFGCSTCADLAEAVANADVRTDGLRRSLQAKVEAACRAHVRGQSDTASNMLCALVHEVSAQADKGIAEQDGHCLRRCEREVRRSLGIPDSCP